MQAASLQMVRCRLERLSRRIALRGLLSSKKAEEAIKRGHVKLDSEIVRENCEVPDHVPVSLYLESKNAQDFHDDSEMGNPLMKDFKGWVPIPSGTPTRIWGFKKPKNVVHHLGALSNPEGNMRSIGELIDHWQASIRKRSGAQVASGEIFNLPPHYSVLSTNLPLGTEGVTLLTNDAEFAHNLGTQAELASVLEIRVRGKLPPDSFRSWKSKLMIGGVNYGPFLIKVYKDQGTNAHLHIQCCEYFALKQQAALKASERLPRPLVMMSVKEIFEHFGLHVVSMKRISYGPYGLADLEPEFVTPLKIHQDLKKYLGKPVWRDMLVPPEGLYLDQGFRRPLPGSILTGDSA